ncbi:MAG: hypothetical protein MRY32_02705 [Rickettsiales bacterium]|nr:hypothetical protein [Rickettsiales bacterium]
MTPELQQEILYSMLRSPFREYPSPHFFSESVFPEAFYDELLENLPADDEYSGIYELGRITNPDNRPETRYVFSLSDDVDKLEGKKHEFWSNMAGLMLGKHFFEAATRKYMPYIVQRFGNTINNYSFKTKCELFRDVEGYHVGPHTDHKARLLNLFFYLPEDDSREHMGTSFYVPRDLNQSFNHAHHNSYEDFIKVATAPYKRNCGAGFIRTDHSFHGVEPLTEKGYKRNALAFMIMVEPRNPQVAM